MLTVTYLGYIDANSFSPRANPAGGRALALVCSLKLWNVQNDAVDVVTWTPSSSSRDNFRVWSYCNKHQSISLQESDIPPFVSLLL